jgi:hypothetical protein
MCQKVCSCSFLICVLQHWKTTVGMRNLRLDSSRSLPKIIHWSHSGQFRTEPIQGHRMISILIWRWESFKNEFFILINLQYCKNTYFHETRKYYFNKCTFYTVTKTQYDKNPK